MILLMHDFLKGNLLRKVNLHISTLATYRISFTSTMEDLHADKGVFGREIERWLQRTTSNSTLYTCQQLALNRLMGEALIPSQCSLLPAPTYTWEDAEIRTTVVGLYRDMRMIWCVFWWRCWWCVAEQDLMLQRPSNTSAL
jgi:hypothetical protein